MPWTGWPLILKEILGTLRSKQQLTTSSGFKRCWLVELTGWAMHPEEGLWKIKRKKKSLHKISFITYCEGLILNLTWQKMKPIKTIWVQIITHSIASPPLSSSCVGGIATGIAPTHPEMSGIWCKKRLDVIHNYLVVPLSVLSWAITDTQEDVWMHAVGSRKNFRLFT